MSRPFILGLDIGITSVGYGLIDYDSKEIIDAGVRIFPEADKGNNEGRRSKRGARRLKRRRIHRLERVKTLLAQYQIITDNVPKSNQPYDIRVKGLTECLTKEELAVALLHIAKRRGIHNVSVQIDDNDGDVNSLSTKEQLNQNARELDQRFVCELQKERLEINGKVRGEQNRFLTKDIIREAQQLIDTQRQFYPDLDELFEKKYIQLVETRREYFEGPGEGSPYGWNADIKKWYQLMMGQCTYYPEELRSVKHTYTAALFNALNDLNNLVIARDNYSKLEYFEKYHIIENVFKQKKNPTLKQIAKEIGVAEQDIKGYRVTKSGQPQFTTFKLFHDLKQVVKDKKILEDVVLLDQIAEVITIYQDETSIIEALNQLEYLLTEQDKREIAKLTGYSGTHRLSLKCMNSVMDELWHTTYNQMEIFTRLGMEPKKYELANQQYIPTNIIEDYILSPVVKRSFKQAIEVVNAVIKRYGLPKNIVIELAREKNSKEKKKFLNDVQKCNEKTRQRIEEIIAEYNSENAKYLIQKIRLHDAQEGKCLYSLKDIPLEDLLRNPNHYEIDHIIPRSVSFDNSMHNKVLVHQEQNSKKSNRTPYQYLTSAEADIDYAQFKQHILNLAKNKERMSKKKREYLLEERDINKYTIQKEFINRNLVDTRYATRELTTLLKAYFHANGLDVKVKTLNGGFTNFLRRRWGFKKERDDGYKHHAEDALIIASADYLFKEHEMLKALKEITDLGEEQDRSSIRDDKAYRAIFDQKYKMKDIKDFEITKFSHRVDKKPNRQLINDTLYSTRQKDGEILVIDILKNLYDKNNEKVKKIYQKEAEKFLMAQHDPATFEKFETIMKQYENEKNPLAQYHEETGDYLRKYAKNGQGPVVKKMKYYSKKLGEHLDITHKYQQARNKVVQLSQKSFRFDIYSTEKGYKMLGISYLDLKKEKQHYVIPQESYHQMKETKSIEEKDIFIGSFYTNDIIKIDGAFYRVIGVSSDSRNIIEVDNVHISQKQYAKQHDNVSPRIKITIGKKIGSIEKYHTDILGNRYKSQPISRPQLIFKKGF
ncbi:type II CRISPR RNA-guided endonuclease Cas9 [Staphylococcus sp. 17KM0847]|uniref:type II CRISPR RNA-guided endonuclease Cas9 n=1 Tax=Staphylococcus sp. 17KM0847 TaxID=2583989 RepID=UPI0015DC0FA7|nr:type II CRISPR RNA-guided endonuclease Cas9 [Staphylococcus sp. 17KM0847]QLK85928.1 type II CRISPR RNA-guided endonuclease Cas9 [Staphylococcus sp. 17KM0847]